MLRHALNLPTLLLVGPRIKQAVRRQALRGAMFALAGLLVLAAIVFVLLALYSALIEAGWGAAAAAALMAGALLTIAVVVLVALRLGQRYRGGAMPAMSGGEAAKEALTHGQAASEALHDLDRQMGRVVRQVGPLSVVAAAFAIGMAAGRRADRS